MNNQTENVRKNLQRFNINLLFVGYYVLQFVWKCMYYMGQRTNNEAQKKTKVFMSWNMKKREIKNAGILQNIMCNFGSRQ